MHWREAMSGKQNKRYRKTVKELRRAGRLDLATLVQRGGRPVRRRTLLRAWAKTRGELKTMREKIDKGYKSVHGPARLFLANEADVSVHDIT
jgi:hypothetical protein